MTKRTRAEELRIMREYLECLGDDPDRPGLKDTPARLLKARDEMFGGINVDVGELLSTNFTDDGIDGFDGFVSLLGYPLYSFCEHHVLPIVGTADVIYMPKQSPVQVVGLSKLGRLVDAYAQRLQVQERLTAQVAHALAEHLEPRAVAVRIRARHFCMEARGVRRTGSLTETSLFLGDFREDARLEAKVTGLLNAHA